MTFGVTYDSGLEYRSPSAIVADAFHTYNAQICDYLITSDKRMVAKTKAIYVYLSVETKVMLPLEFIK